MKLPVLSWQLLPFEFSLFNLISLLHSKSMPGWSKRSWAFILHNKWQQWISSFIFIFLIFCRTRRWETNLGRLRSRLHVRGASHARVWNHAREKPGHGGREEAEVCDATAPGGENWNQEDFLCQLHGDLQNVSWIFWTEQPNWWCFFH